MAGPRAAKSAVSPAAIGVASDANPTIVRPKIAAPIAGDATSSEALARLDAAVRELRALAVAPILRQALAAIRAADFKRGADLCLKALQNDEENGTAWYLLAISREKVGDFKSAINCYEVALKLASDETAGTNAALFCTGTVRAPAASVLGPRVAS